MKESVRKRITKRKVLSAIACGILTGFVFSAGKTLDRTEAIQFDAHFLTGFFVCSLACISFLFLVWELWDFVIKKRRQNIKERRIPFGLCVGIMFVSWLPYWLSIFPGAFSYDAHDEWKMVADGIYTTHHPLIHTLFLGGLVEGFYRLFHNYNIGIAVYTGLQMVLLATIFSYIIRRLNNIFPALALQIVSLAFFSLSPVIGLFSVSSIKDTLFCGAELAFFLLLYEFFLDRDAYNAKKRNIIELALWGLLTMMLRKNGVYIVALCVLMIIATSFKYLKSHYREFALLIIVMILPYLIYIGPITMLFHAKGGEYQEMLSVPIQQMARVYKYNRAELPQEEKEILLNYIPEKNLDMYKATISDNVKTDFRNDYYKENSMDFYCLWIKWGIRYPMTYVSSFLINTVDGWYPGAVIDGYQFDDRSSYFDYRVAPPGEETSILHGFHRYLDSVSHDEKMQSGVLFVLFFSPGFYLLLFVHFWFYALSRKNNAFVGAGALHWFHYLTVLAGPMALVRYELNFFYGLPVFFWLLIYSNKSWKKSE